MLLQFLRIKRMKMRKKIKDYVHSREVLDRIMNDYNETFKTNYDTDNFEGYFSDVSKRMKEVVREEKIDILIVVNMFLTGFDSKKLNTLYVDKNLKHHDLIQAYSRTNRVEKNGNLMVISYVIVI